MLVSGADHPGNLGVELVGRPGHCRLDESDGVGAVSHHPIQPALRAVGREPGLEPRISGAELGGAGGRSAGVLVQGRIAQYGSHLVGVVGPQRFQHHTAAGQDGRCQPWGGRRHSWPVGAGGASADFTPSPNASDNRIGRSGPGSAGFASGSRAVAFPERIHRAITLSPSASAGPRTAPNTTRNARPVNQVTNDWAMPNAPNWAY